MKGEKAMCTLVGDNKAWGFLVRSFTNPPYCGRESGIGSSSKISYLVRVANYQVSWKLVLLKDQFT